MTAQEPLLSHKDQAAIEVRHGDAIATQYGASIANASNSNLAQQDLQPDLQTIRDDAILNAQGHKAELKRRFSPIAALGLGFRCVSLLSTSQPQIQSQYTQAEILTQCYQLMGRLSDLLRSKFGLCRTKQCRLRYHRLSLAAIGPQPGLI